MSALVWRGDDDFDVEGVDRPQAPEGWVVLDVIYAGVCGTDLHICAGDHPRAEPGLVIGHELVGRVTQPVDEFSAGEVVVVDPLLPCGECEPCLADERHRCERLGLIGIDRPGGVAEQVAVPMSALVSVDQSIDLVRLALVEPIAVAVHAIRRARLTGAERIGVVGAGPVGLAVALCARQAGAVDVVIREPVPERRDVANQLGFDAVASEDAVDKVDILFDAAAHPAVARAMTAWTKTGGRIVVVGTYGVPTPVDLQAVTFRELELIGTRVYTREDVETAAALISSGELDPRPLVTDIVPLGDAPQAIHALNAGRGIKVLIEGSV
jgi:2-desacetyl-2-hydroxyethyl bacteriochlorophyllide A dehydrogenase